MVTKHRVLHNPKILQSLGYERRVWLKLKQSTSHQSNLGVIRGLLPNTKYMLCPKYVCKSLYVYTCADLLNSETHSNIYDKIYHSYYYTQVLKSLLIKKDPFESIPGFSDITVNAADEILSMQLLYMLYKWLS